MQTCQPELGTASEQQLPAGTRSRSQCGMLALAQVETWLTSGYEPRAVYALAAAG